tara:strand:+ start:504 stop:1844 length:1341 start_codon:yes stop_codon:yes gene_type:complete
MRFLDDIKLINEFQLKFKGYNIVALSQVFLFEIKNQKDRKSLSQYLKAYSFDNIIKYFISFGLSRKKCLNNPSIVFVNDIYNFSMISNSRILQQEFNSKIIQEIICDKRIYNQNAIFIYKYSRLFATLFDIIKISVKLGSISNELNNLRKSFGVSKLKLWLNICDSIFVVNCIESFFAKNNDVSSVILNSDVHKISRAFVFYCKGRNIKTYVLQHGAPVGHFGYLPVYADKMFNWGSYSYDWFVKNNTPKEKLIVTGTPKTDGIIPVRLNIINSSSDSISLLVILNPIGEDLCRVFLKTIKEFLQISNKKYKLVIKLHPSSNSYKNLPAEILGGVNYKLFHLENLHTLIKDADVLISTPSTAGSEAIAFYKPLLTMNFEEIKYTLAYESYDCNINFCDAESLLFCLEDERRLISKLINYDRFLKDYFFKLDGMSSIRIKDYVTNEK